MSKLIHLYNIEKIFSADKSPRNGGGNLLKDCPSVHAVVSALSIGWQYRHIREIDCSLTIVGGLATGAECRGKLIHSPHI